MMLGTQTFQYIVQNEAEETIGGYTSTAEPPAKGERIKLPENSTWEAAEVVSVSMLLSKRSNRIMLKVKPVDGDRR